MFDMPIRPLSIPLARTTPAGQAVTAKAETSAPKTDVIDLSKPPTPEQAERLRSAGILGYGSDSAAKTVTVQPLSGNTSVTRFTVDYQDAYFDLVHESTVRTSSTGAGVFTSGGSAFTSTTTQLVQSWNDDSWMKSTFHECGFSLSMKGLSSWYVPPKLNEDGSWSLAEYGPSSQITISGYHSVFSVAQSSGGQKQFFQSEFSAVRMESIIPNGQRPSGAVDQKPLKASQELLDQIEKYAGQLRFDTQA